MWQIGDNIKVVRQFTDLNQVGFAEAFGVLGRNGKPSADMLSTYERGITYPPVELIRTIATCAGLDPAKFSKEPISIDDIQEVNLPNELSEEGEASSFHEPEPKYSFKERFYSQLEENNRLLKKQVSLLEDQLAKAEKRLEKIDRIEQRQLTIAQFQGQVDDTLLRFVAEQSHVQDVDGFVKEVYNKYPSSSSPLFQIMDIVDADSSDK